MRAAVVTISDGCHQGWREDVSGARLAEMVEAAGWEVMDRSVLPDERLEIIRRLIALADQAHVELVLTTGGTGAGPRDVTPEATSMVIERSFPGIAEALRAESAHHTPYAILSRGMAGSRGETLIVNLPGSPSAVSQLWPVLKPVVDHACRLLKGENDSHAPA